MFLRPLTSVSQTHPQIYRNQTWFSPVFRKIASSSFSTPQNTNETVRNFVCFHSTRWWLMCQSVREKAAKSKQQNSPDWEGTFSCVKEQEEKVSSVSPSPIIGASWENSARSLVKRKGRWYSCENGSVYIDWMDSICYNFSSSSPHFPITFGNFFFVLPLSAASRAIREQSNQCFPASESA